MIIPTRKYGASAISTMGSIKKGPVRQKSDLTRKSEMTVFLAKSPLMKEVLSVADKFASSDGNVLVLGESGTGKEMLAHYIHEHSPRDNKPFIVVD